MIRDVESYRENVGVLLMYVYMCSYVCRANALHCEQGWAAVEAVCHMYQSIKQDGYWHC